MKPWTLVLFLFLISFDATAAPREFLVETQIDQGHISPATYRIRVLDGEDATISTSSVDSTDRTALTVSASDLGENEHGQEQVLLTLALEISKQGQRIQSNPRIVARLGQPHGLVLSGQDGQPVRIRVKAVRN